MITEDHLLALSRSSSIALKIIISACQDHHRTHIMIMIMIMQDHLARVRARDYSPAHARSCPLYARCWQAGQAGRLGRLEAGRGEHRGTQSTQRQAEECTEHRGEYKSL